MDVYIAHFIDEMQLLCKCIRMYDISRPPSNRSFMLYGVLCWTIHDFPGLSVCSSKIKYLCIYTHNLCSSQLSYLVLYYYFEVINITYWIEGLQTKGIFACLRCVEQFQGGIIKIYINLSMQAIGFFYHQIIGLEIAKRINFMEKLKIEVLHWVWVHVICLRSKKMLNWKLGRIFLFGLFNSRTRTSCS